MQDSSHITSGNFRPLSATDYTIAGGEPDVRGWAVEDSSGTPLGHVGELIVDTDARKIRYFQLRDGEGRDDRYAPVADADLDTDRERVVLRSASSLLSNLGTSAGTDASAHTSSTTRGDAPGTAETQRLTRAEEEVRIGKRAVEAGEVRIGKHVETDHRHEEVSVVREQIHIERRPVSGSTGEIRASGEDIRVPIVEEEVVVEKRPVIKEELVISKERVQETRPVDVEVKREEFDIADDRTDQPGSDRVNPARSRGGH